MNKPTITFILGLVLAGAAGNAAAEGFQPWTTPRVDTPDRVQSAVRIEPFYRQGQAQVISAPDAIQAEIALVPWYLQGGQS